MDKSIREKLINKNIEFESILKVMESSGIDFRDRGLKGPYGVATFYCVYLDVDRILNDFNTRMIFYIILHEIGHKKRIKNMGKDGLINKLSNPDFDGFLKHIVEEEIVADRYSSLMYLKLKKEIFPRNLTQQLDLEYNKNRYKRTAVKLFGVIDNKEENYIKLVESFIYYRK